LQLSASKRDLVSFLRRHRLEDHADILARNGVDLESLRLLKSEDLKEIGLPVGVRRKLLTAANTLALPGSAQDGPGHQASERRHLTILFCDMVDSTALSGNLDPEDFSELMHVYANRTRQVIERYGGHVAKLMGDGIMALFGYPRAHEDDAERAVLAALGCLDVNRKVLKQTGSSEAVDIQVRIGLHSGLAVIGRPDPQSGNEVVGAAPTIAYRLQSEAAPGEILVSPQTRKLAGDRFEYEALEPRVLKGMTEQLIPYRVKREIATRTRFEVRSAGMRTTLVGRDGEVRALLDCWASVGAGSGSSLLLTGAAGIGKSRLSSYFIDAIRGKGRKATVYQCSPHHSGSPLYPVIAWLTHELETLFPEIAGNWIESISAWLARANQLTDRNLALLAPHLSPTPLDGAEAFDMTPRQRLEETLLLLVRCAIEAARPRPLLVLFEDLHWADATTMRLLEIYLQQCKGQPVMVLATYRLEGGAALPSGFAREIRLDRLSESEAMDLVRNVAHPHEIPSSMIRAIVQRSEGLPLFVEEIAKSVVERLVRREGEAGPADHLVPESLVDSLSARLDALPSARRLAQIAAAIGREVPQDILARVSGYSASQYRTAVRELADANLVSSVPRRRDEPLVFSHALIQDVAYQLMLRKDRQSVHARIMEVLERHHPEICNQTPEILARHCELAGQIERAVRSLIDAGNKAIRNSANVEAIKHLKHARELARQPGVMPKQAALAFELAIESAIGTPLISVAGYTSRETVQAFERAEEIAIELGDDNARFHALFGLWGHRWMAGHLDLSLRLSDEILAIASKDAAPELNILAHRCAGSSHWIMGNFEETRRHFEQVKALTEDMDTRDLANRYAVCPRVVALVLGGYALWLGGSCAQGKAEVNEGLERAYRMNHAYSMALSHSMMGGLMYLERDNASLRDHAVSLRAIASDRRFAYWLSYADTLDGAALAGAGDLGKARDRITESIRNFDKMGVLIHRTMQLVLLANIELEAGDMIAASRILAEARRLGRRTGERQWFSIIDARMASVNRPAG
jgi:class 3 adenylate cyclase/tetratricopeptide (TPR) repeat protein